MTKKIPPPLPSGNPEKRNNSAQINDSKITYWFIPPEIGALPIPLIQKNILGVVATFTRNGGECWATDTQFGEAFQWSRQKVNAAINGMVAAGWLRKDVTRLSNGTTPRRLWLASPPIPLSPTVTSSTPNPTDLVTHGDYPCHLERLPLSPTVTTLVTHGDTNSNIIKKEKVIKEIVAAAPTPTYEFPLSLGEPQDSEVPQQSESLKKPIEISEAPPIPAAPPEKQKTKKRKEPSGRKVSFPNPEYWAEKRPDLIDWAKKRGALGTDEEIGRWVDERLEKLEGAAISKDMKYSSWSQTFQNFYHHLIPTQLKKAFDGLVLAANDKNRFHDIWDKAPSAKKFGFEAEGVEAYRYRLKNFDEDSREGGTLLKHFIKTVNAK